MTPSNTTRITLVLCALFAALPLRAESPASEAAVRRDLPSAPRSRTHVLERGETLWTVAVQHGLSVKSIKEANSFDDPDHLPVGTEVNLPLQAAYTLGEPVAEFQQVSFVQPGGAARALLPAPPATEESPGAADSEAPDAAEEAGADGEIAPVDVVLPRGRAPRSRSPKGILARVIDSPTGFIWPVDGFVISPFGKRRRRHRHAGIDLKAPRGAAVLAARDGWVVFSGTVRGHGRVVVLEHEDGFHTVYAHNQKNLVSPEKDGDRVIKAGELIAKVGASGNATTPHVHFEIREDGQPIDPMAHLPSQ